MSSYPLEAAYLAPGEWHHVGVAYSKKGHTAMFLDGKQVAEYRSPVRHVNRSTPHPNGGQFDFVWLSARTPHGNYAPWGRTRGEPNKIKKNTHPKNITSLCLT